MKLEVTEEEKWQLAIISFVKQISAKNDEDGLAAAYEYRPWIDSPHHVNFGKYHNNETIWFISEDCPSAKALHGWICIECEKKGIRL